jgi:integrase
MLEEELRLMDVLIGPRAHLRDLVVMAVNTGLRENELFSLKFDQLDFHRDVINVRETKSGEDRYVPMNHVVRRLLRRLVSSAKQANDESELKVILHVQTIHHPAAATLPA